MNKQNPDFSIIVPVYKVEEVLEKTIDSILKQTHKDFELLLIDDGSPDKSGEICDKYSFIDNRIRVFHQKNKGVSSARNLGLKQALGKNIIFIDSDDIVEHGFLEHILPYVNTYDMVFWGLKVFSLRENKYIEGFKPKQISTNTSSISDLVYHLFKIGLLGYMCSMSVSRKILTENNILFDEDISLHEDSLFCYNCLLHAKSALTLPYQPYIYMVDEMGNSLSAKTPANYYEIALKRISVISSLLKEINMEHDKAVEILSLMKYWSFSRCLNKAYASENKLEEVKKTFADLNSISDFTPYCIQAKVLKFAIKCNSPLMYILGKKIIHLLGK